jgi:hypothetical protein
VLHDAVPSGLGVDERRVRRGGRGKRQCHHQGQRREPERRHAAKQQDPSLLVGVTALAATRLSDAYERPVAGGARCPWPSARTDGLASVADAG